jgi:hypothetical protein
MFLTSLQCLNELEYSPNKLNQRYWRHFDRFPDHSAISFTDFRAHIPNAPDSVSHLDIPKLPPIGARNTCLGFLPFLPIGIFMGPF